MLISMISRTCATTCSHHYPHTLHVLCWRGWYVIASLHLTEGCQEVGHMCKQQVATRARNTNNADVTKYNPKLTATLACCNILQGGLFLSTNLVRLVHDMHAMPTLPPIPTCLLNVIVLLQDLGQHLPWRL